MPRARKEAAAGWEGRLGPMSQSWAELGPLLYEVSMEGREPPLEAAGIGVGVPQSLSFWKTS